MPSDKPTRRSSDNGPAWFAPERIGFGAGLPIKWQGWVLLIAFLVILLALTPLATFNLLAYLSITTTITALFLLIVRHTTRGGWRWRTGKEKD